MHSFLLLPSSINIRSIKQEFFFYYFFSVQGLDFVNMALKGVIQLEIAVNVCQVNVHFLKTDTLYLLVFLDPFQSKTELD